MNATEIGDVAAPASLELESFVSEGTRRAIAAGYVPHVFIRMRQNAALKTVIATLVTNGDIQSGFRQMVRLGMPEWTLEQAVMTFPQEFPKAIRDAAAWRLQQAHLNCA